MADIKISGLATSATSIGGYIPIVIGGVTKKVLVASVFDYISTNDGNGGQPPAPKPKDYASGLTTGEVTVANLVDAATWTNPGGTWEYIKLVFTAVAVPVWQASASVRGVTTGNLSGYGGGYYTTYFLWRVL